MFKTYKFQRIALFEEVGNFQRFRVFDFGPYTKTENLEILSRLINFKGLFYLMKLEISDVSEFSILALILKLKTRKYFQDLQI